MWKETPLKESLLYAESRNPGEHTGVDEELVCDSWMVDIMNGAGKQSSHDLQVCEHSLGWRKMSNQGHSR